MNIVLASVIVLCVADAIWIALVARKYGQLNRELLAAKRRSAYSVPYKIFCY